LLISDGTGLSQISSAYFYKESEVNYSRFQHIGLITTSSSIEDITDSAASATAFSCGQKTYNGAIGVLEDSKQLENIVEIASLKGVKSRSCGHLVHHTCYASLFLCSCF
jgi:alkaline phosphatase